MPIDYPSYYNIRRVLSEAWRLLEDESGQSMTEYIILVAVVSITVAGAFNLFIRVAKGYFRRVTNYVSLPIP